MEISSKIQNSLQKEQVSFRGGSGVKKFLNERALRRYGEQREIDKNARKFFLDQAWHVRLSKTFSNKRFKGDIANVIITGLGTGIIAPLMINFNPLSKEDKSTKTYAAWRQPISAVIAVVTQVGITTQVGRFINKMAEAGDFGKEMNLKTAKNYEYIKNTSEDVSVDLAVRSRDKTKTLRKYFEKKYNEFTQKANKLKENNTFAQRAKVLEQKAKEMQSYIENPDKGREYLSKLAQKYSDKATEFGNRADKITSRISRYKDVVGIGLALVTLPFACGFLNWVYPRFMKKAFPKLISQKEQKTSEIKSTQKAGENK